MSSRSEVLPEKALEDSKETIGRPEDLEHSPSDPIDHDAPVTAADIEFIENFKASPQRAKLMRKMDFRILPILILLYLVSFIDRSNIGNARLEGLELDLGITPQQYSWCLTIFFFFYVPFEMPSNIMLKILRPTRWIPLIMVSWGIVMTLQGITQNYAGLLITRAFLGITEAGFFPAAIYILSNWYLRNEMGRRVAWLYASASLSGSFSGLLAYAIANMDGVAGLRGWRWIFIIEGIATVCIAPLTPFLLTDDIMGAKWLNTDERRYLTKRIKYDRMGKDKGPFQWRYLHQAFRDWKTWAYGMTFFGGGLSTYGMSFALPTIIRQLGYTNANAQLMTIPVYFAAFLTTLTVAYIQDKTERRVRYIIIPYCVSLLGLILCIVTPRPRLPGLTLFGVFLIAMGNYSSVPAVISFCGNNNAGEWKRGIVLGIQIAMGSLGGIPGSNIFLSREAPRYFTGYGIAIAVNIIAQLTAIGLYFHLRSINRKRDALTEDEIYAKYTQEQLDDMGNDSPLYRYEL